ncbi:hypothetical protein CR513_32335, partial [Mucuna pruriens]
MSKRRRNRNGLEGVPRVYVEERLFQFQEEEDWATIIDVLGLLLYGVLLFPYVENYIDLASIEAFLAKRDRGENPTMAVLANTYYTLSCCSKRKEGNLRVSSSYKTWLKHRVKLVGLPWGNIQHQDQETQVSEIHETLRVEELEGTLEQMKTEQGILKRKLEIALEEVHLERQLSDEFSKRAQAEKETRLRISHCLKAADQEMCSKRAERDQIAAKKEQLEEALAALKSREELKETLESWKWRCQDIVDEAEAQVWATTVDTLFWKDRYIKLAWLANQALMDIP